MDSNTHSSSHSAGTPAGLGALVAELQGLAAQDPDRLADAAWAERLLVLRGLVERLEASGWASWPPWMPAGPPAPTTASRPAPPPPGSATACA